jgi:hypothetical protein
VCVWCGVTLRIVCADSFLLSEAHLAAYAVLNVASLECLDRNFETFIQEAQSCLLFWCVIDMVSIILIRLFIDNYTVIFKGGTSVNQFISRFTMGGVYGTQRRPLFNTIERVQLVTRRLANVAQRNGVLSYDALRRTLAGINRPLYLGLVHFFPCVLDTLLDDLFTFDQQ